MRAKTGHEMPERIKEAGHGTARKSFLGLKSSFQHNLWPARLAHMVTALVIAFLLGALFFNYGSKLFDDWRQNRVLDRAAALLKEGKLSKATRAAEDLLGEHADTLPGLYV